DKGDSGRLAAQSAGGTPGALGGALASFGCSPAAGSPTPGGHLACGEQADSPAAKGSGAFSFMGHQRNGSWVLLGSKVTALEAGSPCGAACSWRFYVLGPEDVGRKAPGTTPPSEE